MYVFETSYSQGIRAAGAARAAGHGLWISHSYHYHGKRPGNSHDGTDKRADDRSHDGTDKRAQQVSECSRVTHFDGASNR